MLWIYLLSLVYLGFSTAWDLHVLLNDKEQILVIRFSSTAVHKYIANLSNADWKLKDKLKCG